MDLEIVCRFLFESSKGICVMPKQLVWAANKQVLLTPISPFVKMLKIVGFSSLAERKFFTQSDIELSCSFYPKEAIPIFTRALST